MSISATYSAMYFYIFNFLSSFHDSKASGGVLLSLAKFFLSADAWLIRGRDNTVGAGQYIRLRARLPIDSRPAGRDL